MDFIRAMLQDLPKTNGAPPDYDHILRHISRYPSARRCADGLKSRQLSVEIPPPAQTVVGLMLHVPAHATPAEPLTVSLVQRAACEGRDCGRRCRASHGACAEIVELGLDVVRGRRVYRNLRLRHRKLGNGSHPLTRIRAVNQAGPVGSALEARRRHDMRSRNSLSAF